MGVSTLFKSVLGNKKETSYKIGLALGGGGARGFAHLGVIQALKENGVIPDIIAGSSAGAMVAAFIAGGKEPKEVLEILKEKDLFGYSKFQWTTEGLFSLDGLGEVLKEEIEVNRIEDTKIPLVITVTNLNKGVVEYLREGNLVESVLASSSIPFIFKPVDIDGSRYADGGVLDNLPVKPLLEQCDKVVAVSISPIEETDDLDNALKISARAFQLSINSQDNDLHKSCSLYVEPDGIRAFDLFDVKNAGELFELGYQSISKEDCEKLLS